MFLLNFVSQEIIQFYSTKRAILSKGEIYFTKCCVTLNQDLLFLEKGGTDVRAA